MIIEKPNDFYDLPKPLTRIIESLTTLTPNKLAPVIMELSQIYHDQSEVKNIWSLKNSEQAYLNYFFILNYLRSKAVLIEAQKRNLLENIHSIYDFGSGPGTSFFALHELGINYKKYNCIEVAPKAVNLHKNVINQTAHPSPHWIKESEINPQKNDLAIFSYSMNELKKMPSWIFDMDHLLIIEPSTKNQGRQLMTLRGQLIKKGYSVLAPCTHLDQCPLLSASKKDWCHTRVFINPPEFFRKIESHLPMKNRSVTFSYLLASKRIKNNNLNQWRIIGDTLKEKGKTRQAVCRNSNREFLTSLKKSKIALDFPRGSLIEPIESIQIKGQELRMI